MTLLDALYIVLQTAKARQAENPNWTDMRFPAAEKVVAKKISALQSKKARRKICG